MANGSTEKVNNNINLTESDHIALFVPYSVCMGTKKVYEVYSFLFERESTFLTFKVPPPWIQCHFSATQSH